jgi:hypothetical protein
MTPTALPFSIRVRQAARRLVGRHGVAALREAGALWAAVAHRGDRHECPVCRSRLRFFVPLEDASMTDAQCPVCGSLGRHRFLWLMLERSGLSPRAGQRLLHFAPEWSLERRFARQLGRDYLSADLARGRAMRVLDLTRLDLPDGCFDWVLCSHVLEHVPDDRRALAEIARVLRRGGRLLLQVPVRDGGATVEAPADSTPEYRKAHFGLADHLRLYGDDLPERLAAAGFRVRVWDPRAEASAVDWERFVPDMPPDPRRLFTAQSRTFLCQTG